MSSVILTSNTNQDLMPSPALRAWSFKIKQEVIVFLFFFYYIFHFNSSLVVR